MSQYFGQPELPPYENIAGDTQKGNTCINGRADAHREESLRNKTESIIKPAKNDKDKFVLNVLKKKTTILDKQTPNRTQMSKFVLML